MLNYVVGMNDLALRVMASRSYSSTRTVASHTKSNSPKRDNKRKGVIKGEVD